MKRPPRILKTLLYIRELQEERARERLSQALSALKNATQDLEALRRLQKSLFSELSGRTLSGRDLFLYGQGLEATFYERRRAEEKHQARKEEVENLRKELEKTYQEKEVAERFYERLWRKYYAEIEKKFFREMDDLALMRGRKS